MQIKIIQVPYDSGYKEVRQGKAPAFFLENGLDRALEAEGHGVDAVRIEASLDFPTEVATAFELNRLLSLQVSQAVREGAWPLVLAGNCNSCLGAVSGLGPKGLGVVWFDAHGEFNTPDTTGSGWLDGMPLAMATGRCWTTLLRTIPGFEPVRDENIVLVGARDLDRVEEARLDESGIHLVRTAEVDESGLAAAVSSVMERMAGQVDGIYIHIDMDALDLDGGRANQLHPPGGVKPGCLAEIIGRIKDRFPVKGATFASYDPSVDHGKVALKAAIWLAKEIAKDL